MQTQVFLGIVIKTAKVKESNMRVHLLTAEGIKVCEGQGATKPTAKLKAALQLFTIAEFCVLGHRITGAHVLSGGMGITREINRYYLASSICEVLNRLHISENSGSVFVLTAKALEQLKSTDMSCYKVFINYFTKLLGELGYDIEDNHKIFNTFKNTPDDEIDTIKLSLPVAKSCVKHLAQCYLAHLDVEICCAKQFA